MAAIFAALCVLALLSCMSPLIRVISDANGFQHQSYHLLSYGDVQIHLPHKNCHIKITRVNEALEKVTIP